VQFTELDTLTSVILPTSLERMDGSVFQYCKYLNKFVVSADNQYFKVDDGGEILLSKDGKELISWPYACENITIPDSVTKISDYALSMSYITSVDLNYVVEIGDFAFYYTDIEKLTIPSSVTKIGKYAFYSCEKLTSVEFADTNGWSAVNDAGLTESVTVTDADKVAADKETLELNVASVLTANLTLPTTGATYGSTITWATSDESVITTDGKINRVGEDKTATLTATIKSGEVTDTKTFDVTVKAYERYELDLSAENNILLGKKITAIAGYYYSNSDPSDATQYATDGDITTLGRGGSDTTAVALAAFLKADKCQIFTDVDGVYNRDPRIYPDATRFGRIGYDRMLTLIENGAQVLHDRSVEFVRDYGIAVEVLSAFTGAPGTIVGDLESL